jgi:hypothetical protein
MSGMVKTPLPTTLATALPLIVPNRLEARTAILAGPPRNHPPTDVARSMKNRPPPEASSTAENRTK